MEWRNNSADSSSNNNSPDILSAVEAATIVKETMGKLSRFFAINAKKFPDNPYELMDMTEELADQFYKKYGIKLKIIEGGEKLSFSVPVRKRSRVKKDRKR